MSIRIGTSGWHYPHWVGAFYPAELGSKDWLHYYARHFRCVEINSTFYRLPAMDSIERWLAQTPEDFSFTLKASRYITHMKKLRDCATALSEFLSLARHFGDRLAAILLQLPPHWHANHGRLADFLRLLPDDLRFAMEFRDPSWHVGDTYRLLREYGVGFCQFELGGFHSPPVVTAELVYLRLHGPGEAYAGSYDEDALKRLADSLTAWDGEGHDVHVFFDNDRGACSVNNAFVLQQLVKA
jgi:uncharacterized protein YecE (DUF72 family)